MAKSRVDDVTVRVQKLEARLAKLEETVSQASARLDSAPEPRMAKAVKSTPPVEAVVTASGITPTSAFNLAYNDYLNGKYELSVAGFQRSSGISTSLPAGSTTTSCARSGTRS